MKYLFTCFNLNLILLEYTELSQSEVTQRQSFHYSGSIPLLKHVLTQLAGNIEILEGSETKWKLYNCIDLTINNKTITIEVSNNEQIVFMFL